MNTKKIILKILFNLCLFIGLSYDGIFWSKEVKKIEEEFNKFLEKDLKLWKKKLKD